MAPVRSVAPSRRLFPRSCSNRGDTYGCCPGLLFGLPAARANRSETAPLAQRFCWLGSFVNSTQDLGWKRAGTLNLNIRYNAMSLALVAEAALYQLRRRPGDPYENWNAAAFADKLLEGLDGDVRVSDDTITVTYYDVPQPKRWQRLFQRSPSHPPPRSRPHFHS